MYTQADTRYFVLYVAPPFVFSLPHGSVAINL